MSGVPTTRVICDLRQKIGYAIGVVATLLFVLGVAPILAGCATPAAQTVASVQTISEQSLIGAETLYNVPAQIYVTADQAGQLSPSVKATVKPILQTMKTWLDKAEAAYKIGDAVAFLAAQQQLTDLNATATTALNTK